MKTALLPTQITDVDQITAGTDIHNYSEAGTGKTLTTIGAIEALRLQSGLIVCPPIATKMWVESLENELGAKVQWLATRTTEIDKTADFLVASYGVLDAHSSALMERANDVLVLDELHKLKSADAIRTQLIFGERCDGQGAIYETSIQCWGLSGTPIERYADDLWPHLRCTQPEILQRYHALSKEAFQRQFCRMGDYGGKVHPPVSVATQNEKLLNEMLYKDIGVVRRTMKEVDPYMPEATFRNITVRSFANAELIDLLVGKSIDEIETILMDGGVAATRMRQLLGLSKLDDVVDYINSIDHPVLVGYWHTDVGTALAKRLTGNVYRIGGDTSHAKREQIKKKWMDGNVDVLVGQIGAMGEALDGLQFAGKHVIFAEFEWSAAKMEQFYKRIKRKGQTQHVQVDYCVSQSVIDTALRNVAQKKATSSALVLDKVTQ